MTRIRNLTRFTVATAAIVWGLAFNAAAYVAWVTYVILPSSRVTGAPAMNWTADAVARDPHYTPGALTALLLGIARAPWAPSLALLALPLLIYILWRLGAHKASDW